jgi:hypothetical protein
MAPITAQRLGGIIEFLHWRIKHTWLFFTYRYSIEHDLTQAIAIAVFNKPNIQLTRIVARIRVESHLIGILFHIEGTGNLHEVGVGIGVKKSIDDGLLLVVGIDVDVGGTSGKQGHKRQTKDEIESFHSANIVDYAAIIQQFSA